MTDTLADQILDEAALAPPSQAERLQALAAEVAALTTERDQLRRGGKALGDSLAFWLDLAVKVTGSENCIEDDGDGDYGVVAERLAAMAPTEAVR